MKLETLIQKEFQLDDQIIYLNHAAVSPWPVRTAETVSKFAEENAHIGATHYPEWLKKESLLRGQLQGLINAPSVEDIALLKNTSEALSVVAEGLDDGTGDLTRVHQLPKRKRKLALRDIGSELELSRPALLVTIPAP